MTSQLMGDPPIASDMTPQWTMTRPFSGLISIGDRGWQKPHSCRRSINRYRQFCPRIYNASEQSGQATPFSCALLSPIWNAYQIENRHPTARFLYCTICISDLLIKSFALFWLLFFFIGPWRSEFFRGPPRPFLSFHFLSMHDFEKETILHMKEGLLCCLAFLF